ncbi:hypothetical protein EMGBS15_02090 [Filimonas sp.]|nr:hypothetical protein EMGBS15_02090 [Filimonas sp.]
MYPNPAIQQADVQISSSKNATAELTITNVVGAKIASLKEKVEAGIQLNSNMPSAVYDAKGVYLVTVEIDHIKNTEKIVIE